MITTHQARPPMTDTLTELEKVRREIVPICQYESGLVVNMSFDEPYAAKRARQAIVILDTIIAQQKATEEAIEAVRVRLVQIASGDYRACGHLAEAVALDALAKINTILKEPTNE